MEGKENQEVDLSIIFDKIGGFFNHVFNLFARFFRFVIRNIIILSLLIIVGAVAGYFWQKSISLNKNATVIIKCNLDSTPFIYESIETIQHQIIDKNKDYLKSIGLISGDEKIVSIEIKPYVNISDLLNRFKDYDDEQVLMLLDKVKSQDEFLEARALSSDYMFQEIQIEVSNESTNSIVNSLIEYLGEAPYFEKRLEIIRTGKANEIRSNEITVNQIDTLISKLGDNLTKDKTTNSELIYLGDNNLNINSLLERKATLLLNNTNLRENLLELENTFVVVNKPTLTKVRKITDNKLIILPLILVIAFFLIHFIKYSLQQIVTNDE